MSLEQEGFRWRNDDGGEGGSPEGASWKAPQDQNISLALDTAVRLRILVNADGEAPATSNYRLEYRLVESQEGQWLEVEPQGSPASSGRVRMVPSSHITAGGEDTTAHLIAPAGSPKSFTAGRIWDDESGEDSVALANDQYTELEWAIEAVSANGAQSGDVYEFRVTRRPATVAGGGLSRVDIQGNNNGTNGTGQLTCQITTSGSNRLVVVFFSIDSSGDISPTGTHNGNSLGTATEDATTGQYQGVFVLVNPDVGTDLNVVVNTGLNNFSGSIVAVSFSGVDQATPIGTIDAVGGTAANGSSGTVSCAAGNWIISGAALDDNSGTVSVTGGGNDLVQSFGNGAGSVGHYFAEDRDGADDTIDWAWTNSVRWSALSFELKAA